MKTPPLLIGSALVFWGWQTGYILPGIIMAAILEGSRRVNRRWEMSARDFHRISDLCAVIILVMLAYRLLAETASNARWLPMGLFPLILGQAFSTVGGVDLGAIFYVVRQKEKKEKPKARRTFDMSFPYFALTLLATSAANVRTPLFYTGMFLLIGWALFAVRPARTPLILWAALLISAGALGWAGQIGLRGLHLQIEDAALSWYQAYMGRDLNPFKTVTAIGDVGELKLSNRILLRVRARENSARPEYLIEATYNRYKAGRWFATDAQLRRLSPEAGGDAWQIGSRPERSAAITVSERLRRGSGVLSLPLNAFRIEDLPVERLERSRFNVVRVRGGPGLVNYRVAYGADLQCRAPFDVQDMQVPDRELPGLRKFVHQFDLAAGAPADMIKNLQRFFQNRFHYSLVLQNGVRGRTPIENFLFESRTGHCEFFATATVLLLRAAGIPARYATGYRVDEFSRWEDCYVVRSRHAHAWALAHINGAWQSVDTTPVIWLDVDSRQAPRLEPLYDFFGWVLHRFWHWRWSQRRGGLPDWAVWLVVPLIAILAWRIVFRKRAVRLEQKTYAGDAPERVPGSGSAFYRIEKSLARHGCERRTGETQRHCIQRFQASGADPAAVAAAKQMLAVHYRMRFHPQGVTKKEAAQLEKNVLAWLGRYDSDAAGLSG